MNQSLEQLESRIKILESDLDDSRKHIELMKQENQRLRTEVLEWRKLELEKS